MGKAKAEVGAAWNGEFATVQELAAAYAPAPSEQNAPALIAYGRAMMAWNTTEMILGLLLEVLISEDEGAGRATVLALTSDLGGVALETAVGSLAPHVCGPDRLPDIEYALALVSRVRAYRNYYAHGISWLAVDQNGAVAAPIWTWTARPKIKQHKDAVTVTELDTFTRWCAETSAFIKAVIERWYPLAIDGKTAPPPQRPEMPPPCKKTATHLQAHPRSLRKGPT